MTIEKICRKCVLQQFQVTMTGGGGTISKGEDRDGGGQHDTKQKTQTHKKPTLSSDGQRHE